MKIQENTYNLKSAFLFFLMLFLFQLLHSQNGNSERFLINSVKITGNYKTKEKIILRELTFAEGDSIYEYDLISKITLSKKNLLNTPLFNFVNFEIRKSKYKTINIIIKVEERWYFWPQAAIYYADRNFSNWLKNKDLSRTDIGLGLIKYNFRGRNEKLSFYTILGYDEELILKYENIFFDKKRKHSAGIYLKYLQRKETGVKIKDDKLLQIKLENEYALKLYNLSFKYTFRKKYFNTHSAYFGFENRRIADTLSVFNPEYFSSNNKKIDYFFLKYIFKQDKRNSRVFPTKGHFFKITVAKFGFNLFPDSKINSFYIKTEVSKYSKLSKRFNFGNYISFRYKNKNDRTFFLNTAIGYSSNLRGYEYYLINGTNFCLSKNTLNFELLPKKIFYLRKLPLKRFNKIHFTIYTSIFSDIGYVQNSNIIYTQNNAFANKLLYSYGAGLNFLTYYDTLLRLEYSINHKKEGGFYLHFEVPF